VGEGRSGWQLLQGLQALRASALASRAARFAFHFSTKKCSTLLLPAGERFVIDPYSEGMLLSETEVKAMIGLAGWGGVLPCCCCAHAAAATHPQQLHAFLLAMPSQVPCPAILYWIAQVKELFEVEGELRLMA